MGVLYISLAAVFFGSNPSIEQVLLGSGMSSCLIATEIMMWGCVFSGIAAVVRRESFRVDRRQLGILLLAGTVGRGLTEICLVTAYTMIPAGIATMVHFFFPTIVCLTCAIVYHEPMTGRKWAAILLSAGGLFGLAGGVSGSSFGGILAAGISSITFGMYYLMTERSCLRTLPPMVMIFYVHLFAVIETAVLVTVRGEWIPAPGLSAASAVMAGGLVCFLGYLFLNRGIPMVGADTAGFINMLEPVTSVVLSVLLFHVRLSVSSVLGCLLILGSMLVSSVKEPVHRVRDCCKN